VTTPLLLRPAPIPATATRAVPAGTLTAAQLAIVHDALTLLGTDEGVLEDEPPLTIPAARVVVSRLAATVIGLNLTRGHEIAQCHDCADVIDGFLATEDGGYLRCPHCHTLNGYATDPGYRQPDTTLYDL
jgi:hypothetical protein